MSSAVKEIIKKASTLNGKERQELFQALPNIFLETKRHFTEGQIAALARLAKKRQGLKTFKTKEAFIHHIRNI